MSPTRLFPASGDANKTEAIGFLLEKFRWERQMSLRDMAKEMGVSHQTILNWSNGANSPHIERILRLSTLGWVGELRKELLAIMEGK